MPYYTALEKQKRKTTLGIARLSLLRYEYLSSSATPRKISHIIVCGACVLLMQILYMREEIDVGMVRDIICFGIST